MSEHGDTIREALAPRVPNEHHSNCSEKRGVGECNCYARKSNAALAALTALEAERDDGTAAKHLVIAWEDRDVWRARAVAAEQREAALREALEEIVGCEGDLPTRVYSTAIARRALARGCEAVAPEEPT